MPGWIRILCCLGLLFAAHASRATSEVEKLLDAAIAQVGVTTSYDPAYVPLAYPGGDVPLDRGVCSDVLIRAFRAVDVDLQVQVHEDMSAHFSKYPRLWGLRRADANIDHRRVPNLETWFNRRGKALPLRGDASDFLPGDVVSWRLDNGLPHVGLVLRQRSADGARPLVIHNIGVGTQVEDVLLQWKINGHFRYFPVPTSTPAH